MIGGAEFASLLLRRTAFFLALSALCVGPGCKRAPREAPRLRLRVVEISAEDRTAPGLPGAGAASADALLQACTEGLRRAGVDVALHPEALQAGGDFRLQVDVRLDHVAPSADTGQRGLMRAQSHGRLRALTPAGRGGGSPGSGGGSSGSGPVPELTRFDQDAVAEKTYQGAAGAPGAAAWAEHARRTVQDTAEALGSQVRLLGADRALLLATLQRKDLDPDLRSVAIALVGLRKEREALPVLIELLKDPEAEVRDKAIGALIEIGDRRAVKALAQSAAFHDTFELGKILEAVAALGGDEARSYLEFVAAGHQSAEIREEAKVALGHLEQREGRDAGP